MLDPDDLLDQLILKAIFKGLELLYKEALKQAEKNHSTKKSRNKPKDRGESDQRS